MKPTPYDILCDELEAANNAAIDIDNELRALYQKRNAIIQRMNELKAIEVAHIKDGIDIVKAKLSGEYANADPLYVVGERGIEVFDLSGNLRASIGNLSI